jgi:hypothetical protein
MKKTTRSYGKPSHTMLLTVYLSYKIKHHLQHHTASWTFADDQQLERILTKGEQEEKNERTFVLCEGHARAKRNVTKIVPQAIPRVLSILRTGKAHRLSHSCIRDWLFKASEHCIHADSRVHLAVGVEAQNDQNASKSF